MGAMATVRVNTTQSLILYRDFIIQEAYEPGQGNVWEWTHEDYDRETNPVTGTCQTLFECIDAVGNWHDNRDEAVWIDHQQSLMESVGSDDSCYRRDMIAAGRGHLIGDAK